MGRSMFIFLLPLLLNSLKAASQLNLKQPLNRTEKKISIRPLPQNFYNQRMGFFCRNELQLQKKTGIPLFIRVGSKEQVDYLEQKPNSQKRIFNWSGY